MLEVNTKVCVKIFSNTKLCVKVILEVFNMMDKESLKIEFKSEKKNPISDHELIDEVVGMANALGGTIYLGVEDDGTISGASKNHQDVDGLSALIANKTIPSVFVKTCLKKIENKIIVCIEVPISKQVIASTQGKVLQRRIKANGEPEVTPFFPFEFTSRTSFLSEFDPSENLIIELGIKDFDNESLLYLKKEMSKSGSIDKALIDLNEEEFYLSLGLLRKNDNKLCMTLAGLLFLGKEKDLQRYAPSVLFTYQILKNGVVYKNEEKRENIVSAFRSFDDFITSFNFEDEMLINLRRIGIPYYDYEALREAFSNAISHRDYALLGTIRVSLDESGLIISNPGSFIYGLNINSLLLAEPRGRNPLLSLVLKRTGYAEKTGRGIDKIFYSQARYGKAWPDYSLSTDSNTILYLPKSEIDEDFAKKIMDLDKKIPLFSVLILSYIRKNNIATKTELMGKLGFSEERIESYLIPLLDNNIIEPINKIGPWMIKETFIKGKINRPLPNELLLNKIIELAKNNNGYLTNKDVQSKLGIESAKSYYLIKLLVKQNKLELIRSGKYALYKLI